jgi:hypothetical protein
MANETPNYRMPMPSKMGERGSTSGRSYDRAQTTRQGVHTQATPPTKEASKMTMQPGPVNPPNFPDESNGFAPDIVSADTGNDAQDQQTEQPPISTPTEPAAVPETTARPPEANQETSPIIEGENADAGGVTEPRYPAKLPAGHPCGYPSD